MAEVTLFIKKVGGGAGASSLIKRYTDKTFEFFPIPALHFKERIHVIGGQVYQMRLWDDFCTPVTYPFPYRGSRECSNNVVLVVDISSVTSFRSIESAMAPFYFHDVRFYLLLNKCDLLTAEQVGPADRTAMKNNIVQLLSIAQKHKQIKAVFRVSAKKELAFRYSDIPYWDQLDSVFLQIVHDIINSEAGSNTAAASVSAHASKSLLTRGMAWLGKGPKPQATVKSPFFPENTTGMYSYRDDCPTLFSQGRYNDYSENFLRIASRSGAAPGDTQGEIPKDKLCNVCLDKEKTHLFLPCGHLCVCETCMTRIMTSSTPSCPICRVLPHKSIRVYN